MWWYFRSDNHNHSGNVDIYFKSITFIVFSDIFHWNNSRQLQCGVKLIYLCWHATVAISNKHFNWFNLLTYFRVDREMLAIVKTIKLQLISVNWGKMAKATTIKDALKRWEDQTKKNSTEATEIGLQFQWPPIEKLDNTLSTLTNCE